MSSIFRSLLTAFLVCAYLALPAAAANTGQSLTVHASFNPDALGVPTNLSATAKFDQLTQGLPSPITNVTALGPAGITVDLRGAGTCSAATLQELGPSACPADSRAGFGNGVGLVQIAEQIIHEPFTIDIFVASKAAGHLVLLGDVNGVSPVSLDVVVVAKEIHAPKPYGLGFSIAVPPIPTLPGAANAAIDSAFVTFGSTHVAYYKQVHGKKKLFHVRGLITPKTCPRGGFPLEGQISFADGTTSIGKATIPCPPRRK